MMDRFSKGATYAMIPSGIVSLLMWCIFILGGFLFIIVMHGIAIEYMFPEEIKYTVINQHYGTVSTIDLTPEFNLYPFFWCLFVDSSIILGICGFFNINFSTALLVVLFILFAPITIPTLLIMFLISKLKNKTTSSSSLSSQPASSSFCDDSTVHNSQLNDLGDKF